LKGCWSLKINKCFSKNQKFLKRAEIRSNQGLKMMRINEKELSGIGQSQKRKEG